MAVTSYVISNATHTGGQWTRSGITWTPVGGVAAAGSIRELNPADGSLAIVGGKPFELALPSNIRGPCTINGNSLMVCAGGHSGVPLTDHDNGLFIVDTTKAAAVLRHLEDKSNYSEFSQPAQEHGAILAANTNALVKWAT